MPAVLDGSHRFKASSFFNMLRLAGDRYSIAGNIADLAKAVKAFTGTDVADFAGQNLKWSDYFEPSCQVFTFATTRFATISHRALLVSAMTGFQLYCDKMRFMLNTTLTFSRWMSAAAIRRFFRVASVISGCENTKLFGPLYLGVFLFGVYQVAEISYFHF